MKNKIFVLCAIVLGASNIADASEDLKSLSELSFSDLGGVVTSVSKRPEKSFQAAAAVHVITHEDIKHSGLRSIPELLRMVPGLQVARSDPKIWAITSRGFNADGFGNKLLVLIDGRTVYTPLFSGVYWDAQDTFIEDIERIEVIRGPGATLWGANAVNGVINIITKKAKDTQTKVINTGIDDQLMGFVEGRYGGTINDNIYYRVYAKRFNQASSVTLDGNNGQNSGYSNRSGFRFDVEEKNNDFITVQGDVYYNYNDLSLNLPDFTTQDDDWRVSGGNLLSRIKRTHENKSESVLQVYYDLAGSNYTLIDQQNHTFDVDYQYSPKLSAKHNVVLGVGYRYIKDRLRGSEYLSYSPQSRGRSLFSAFFQDTVELMKDKLALTFGSKFEHNDFTGFEFQPNLRMSWTPSNNRTLWLSVARAVRTPNRSEDDISLAILPGYIRWIGNREFESEELLAFELGYRVKPKDNLLIDTTVFINSYDNLRTNEFSLQPVPSDTLLGLEFDNKAEATSFGAEASFDWRPKDIWTVKGSYTFLVIDVDKKDMSTDSVVEQTEGISPRHQFSLHSQLYLPYSLELGNSLYYVGELPAELLNVPSYFRFDTRLAWEPKPGVQFSLIGQNLFDSEHQEFSAPLHGVANEIKRSFYAMVSLRF